MFFHVDERYGLCEVYRGTPGGPIRIDPHAIFETKAVGYDNIHRNMLVSVLDRRLGPAFCAYLRRKFPGNKGFAVVHAQYPDVIRRPDRLLRGLAYRCE
jgi:hypothetical protein